MGHAVGPGRSHSVRLSEVGSTSATSGVMAWKSPAKRRWRPAPATFLNKTILNIVTVAKKVFEVADQWHTRPVAVHVAALSGPSLQHDVMAGHSFIVKAACERTAKSDTGM